MIASSAPSALHPYIQHQRFRGNHLRSLARMIIFIYVVQLFEAITLTMKLQKIYHEFEWSWSWFMVTMVTCLHANSFHLKLDAADRRIWCKCQHLNTLSHDCSSKVNLSLIEHLVFSHTTIYTAQKSVSFEVYRIFKQQNHVCTLDNFRFLYFVEYEQLLVNIRFNAGLSGIILR